MSEWKKGKYLGACPNRRALKDLLRKCATRKIAIKGDDGIVRQVPADEIVLEQMFHNAIRGDSKAQKVLFELAVKYWHDPDKKSPPRRIYLPYEITQSDVNKWINSGSLPPGCSEILSEISTNNLNKAYRLHTKKGGTLAMWDELAKQFGVSE